jgi:hypothetical protein
LPTKLALIGLDFENNGKIIGWFLFTITLILFINFLVFIILDYTKYFRSNLLNKKLEQLTGDTIGLTYKEIGKEYDRQEEYTENYQNDNAGSLRDEANDIKRKIQILENRFDLKHLRFYHLNELFFNALIPIILTSFGLKYLYYFLIML